MINIVLIEPRIPQNTGNIARLCVGADCTLHLIKPFGFVLSDKYLKRSAMDYWKHLDYKEYDDLNHFWSKFSFNDRHFLATTKTKNNYFNTTFKPNDFIYFGREDKGINEELLNKYKNQNITIPMSEKIRSINLANSVGIILYEAVRQNSI